MTRQDRKSKRTRQKNKRRKEREIRTALRFQTRGEHQTSPAFRQLTETQSDSNNFVTGGYSYGKFTNSGYQSAFAIMERQCSSQKCELETAGLLHNRVIIKSIHFNQTTVLDTSRCVY